MKNRDATNTPSPGAEPAGIVERLRRWWRPVDGDARYLAAASDLADLERRMRALERARGGPVFVTFNH